MKKTLIYGAAAFVLFAASCKEHNIPVTPPSEGELTSDTSYVLPVEAPEDRLVYIEEFTGVQCVNCPGGATVIEQILEDHPNQVVSLSFHATSNPVSDFNHPIVKPVVSKYDFRTYDGDKMLGFIWNEKSQTDTKPSASFDRAKLSGSNYKVIEGAGSWAGTFTTDLNELGTKAPVNVSITSNYVSASNRYDIVATVKYTSTTTQAYALNLYLSEDSVIDSQEFSPINYDSAYVFNHIFRKAITDAAAGKIILPDMATKVAGTVYVYKTSVTIDPSVNTYDPFSTARHDQGMWNPDHMKVTAVVNIAGNPNDIHTVQVKQTALKN